MLDEIRSRILLLWLGVMNVSPITQPVPTNTAEEHQMLGSWKRNAPARLTCARTNQVGPRARGPARCVFAAAADRTWTHTLTPSSSRRSFAAAELESVGVNRRTAKLHVDSLVRLVDPSFKIRLRHYLWWLRNPHFQQRCVVWAVELVRWWLRPQDWFL